MNLIKLLTYSMSKTAYALLVIIGTLENSAAQSLSDAKLGGGQFEQMRQAALTREPLGLRIAAEHGLQNLLGELGRDLKPGNLPEGFPLDVSDFLS